MLKDEQIFDILDGCATEETLKRHLNLMAHSEVYQKYFKDLEAMHFDLINMPLEKPSENFVKNILAIIPAESTALVTVRKNLWSTKLTYAVFGAMVFIMITATAFTLLYTPSDNNSSGWFSMVSFKEFRAFLTQDFTKIALLLNLIVLLIIFDKRVLRPYFNHRKVTLG